MNKRKILAPRIDGLMDTCQGYPEIKNRICIDKLIDIFNKLSELEVQGDDEYRSIWLTAERGKIDDFGNYNDYLDIGEVSNRQEFKELWVYYYPDKMKWYKFAIARYAGVYYFYIDSKLTFQFNPNSINEEVYDFQSELTEWLTDVISERMMMIQSDADKYNEYVNTNLPYQKRTGRILRKDFWEIFPEDYQDFKETITPEVFVILKEIDVQTKSKKFKHLNEICSGDFFRFCDLAYSANNYFKSDKYLSSKDKYIAMSDGRDCGLRNLDESSCSEFAAWFRTERNCGGHPWEICRGGNSTHISLYVCQNEKGWYLRLEGSSRVRVIETILMAVAFYRENIPFVLGKSEEIYNMAGGTDFIGIVPENVIPRYCHSYFPPEDNIIDFMNLGTERKTEIIKKTYWYPLPPVKLCENIK